MADLTGEVTSMVGPYVHVIGKYGLYTGKLEVDENGVVKVHPTSPYPPEQRVELMEDPRNARRDR